MIRSSSNGENWISIPNFYAEEPGADKSHCRTPWASAFLGRASGFNVHNMITGKLKASLDKSFENSFVSPWRASNSLSSGGGIYKAENFIFSPVSSLRSWHSQVLHLFLWRLRNPVYLLRCAKVKTGRFPTPGFKDLDTVPVLSTQCVGRKVVDAVFGVFTCMSDASVWCIYLHVGGQYLVYLPACRRPVFRTGPWYSSSSVCPVCTPRPVSCRRSVWWSPCPQSAPVTDPPFRGSSLVNSGAQCPEIHRS